MKVRLEVLLFLAAVWLVQPATIAWAGRNEDARVHFVKGQEHYDAGEYAQAITDFEAAYALRPVPLLLYDIAQALRLKGDCPKALEYYRRYLAEDPEPANRTDIDAAIARCEAAVAPPATPTPEPTPPSAQQRPEPAPIAATVPRPSAPAPTSGRGLRIAGIATTGVGVSALGAAIVLGLGARSDAATVEAHTGEWDSELQSIEDRGQSRSRLAIVSAAVGAAAVLGGGTLYFLGRRSARPDRRTALEPVAGGAIVRWTCEF